VSAPRPSDRDYVEQLGAVLRRRDPAALRDFLSAQATQFGDERQAAQLNGQSLDEIETLMHRMTLARSDLSEYHAASRAWLAARGIQPPTIDRGRRN
jgi:hypothetical protein